MSSSNVPAPSLVEDDKTKPWKALAAAAAPIAVAAVLAILNLVMDPEFDVPEWVKLVSTVLAAGIAAYAARNPKVIARHDDNRRVDDGLR